MTDDIKLYLPKDRFLKETVIAHFYSWDHFIDWYLSQYATDAKRFINGIEQKRTTVDVTFKYVTVSTFSSLLKFDPYIEYTLIQEPR